MKSSTARERLVPLGFLVLYVAVGIGLIVLGWEVPAIVWIVSGSIVARMMLGWLVRVSIESDPPLDHGERFEYSKLPDPDDRP